MGLRYKHPVVLYYLSFQGDTYVVVLFDLCFGVYLYIVLVNTVNYSTPFRNVSLIKTYRVNFRNCSTIIWLSLSV